MKTIKLTSATDGDKIYINIEQIGHYYDVKEKIVYSRVEKKAHTRIGVTTHNNGGFEVIETADKIDKMINKLM
jgi:hypothetical protein